MYQASWNLGAETKRKKNPDPNQNPNAPITMTGIDKPRELKNELENVDSAAGC